jgi:hypothetical protein
LNESDRYRGTVSPLVTASKAAVATTLEARMKK